MTERLQLVEAELDTLYIISQVLNSTHDLHAKLEAVLEIQPLAIAERSYQQLLEVIDATKEAAKEAIA